MWAKTFNKFYYQNTKPNIDAWMNIDFILFEAKDYVNTYCWMDQCSYTIKSKMLQCQG